MAKAAATREPDGTTERLAQLVEWEAAAQREVDKLSVELARVQHQLNAAREQVELLRRLIALQRKDESGEGASSTGAARSAASDWAVRGDLEGHVQEILAAAGQPMHIGEIRRRLIDDAVPLPGRGDESNIIVRLSRASDTFTRTARGTYALASWGLPAMPRPTRRRKSSR